MAKKIELDLAEVERLAGLGMSEEQIATALGVSAATVDRRKRDTDGFEEALKRGRAAGIAHVTNKLRELIDGGNTTASIFFLKCRAGWCEQADIERRIEKLERTMKARAVSKGGEHELPEP